MFVVLLSGCAIAWKDVCRPVELGGLGVLDIKRLSWALRARWPWLRHVDPAKPWAMFPIHSNAHVEALVHLATSIKLGNGTKVLFWSDRWIAGQNISQLAPAVLAAVRPNAVSSISVAEGLTNNSWIRDISGTLSVEGVLQFLLLVNLTEAQVLSPATEDEFIWNLSSSSLYSSKSACSALFVGRTLSPHHLAIWDCWAPLKCKVFAWLAAADRCWTGERRLRHGMSTSDTGAVCDQESESISHLLLQCPFAKQVWFHTLSRLGLQACLPGPDETFSSWFETAATRVAPSLLKAARSIIILTLENLEIQE
ncbi:hypothetical protein ACQ4PT_041790 [Festuca glaucescens]